MKNKFAIACLIWMSSSLQVFASAPCEVFYKTALYDEVHTKVKTESKYLSVTKFCSAYESSKSSDSGAAFEFVIKNIPMGGNLSKADRNTVASNICNRELTDTMDSADVDILSKVVSPEGAGIVKECLKANTYGLKVEEFAMDLAGSKSLSVSIIWNPLRGSSNDNLMIQKINIRPSNKNVVCEGPLWEEYKNGRKLKPNLVRGLTCINSSDHSAALTIYTDNGTLNFPIEPKTDNTCKVHEDIFEFLFTTPKDQKGIISTEKNADRNYIWQQDVNKLISLYEGLLDNCGKKGFVAYDRAYFDLQDAVKSAQDRYRTFVDDYKDWHMSFFSKYTDYLRRTKNEHKDFTNELYFERTCRFEQCPK